MKANSLVQTNLPLDLEGIVVENAEFCKAFPRMLTARREQENYAKYYLAGFDHSFFYVVKRLAYEKEDENAVFAHNGQPYHAVRMTRNPSTDNYIKRHLPDWLALEVCDRYLEEKKKRVQYLSKNGQHGTSWEIYPFMSELLNGRFEMTGMLGKVGFTNLRDALWIASVNDRSLSKIEYTPDVEVLIDGARAVWSDGHVGAKIKKSAKNATKLGMQITKSAQRLIDIALSQKDWRASGNWKKLLTVSNEEQQKIETLSRSGWSWSNAKTLYQINTDTGLSLYLFVNEGGALGEDGDAWCSQKLFENREDARAYYKDFEID